MTEANDTPKLVNDNVLCEACAGIIPEGVARRKKGRLRYHLDCGSKDLPQEPQPQPEIRKFASGAVRSKDVDAFAFHLMSPIALKRYAKVCKEGSVKYAPMNWEKGLPIDDILNHAINHLLQYLMGDDSEDHLGHALWNVAAAVHSDEMWPDLNREFKGLIERFRAGGPRSAQPQESLAAALVERALSPSTHHCDMCDGGGLPAVPCILYANQWVCKLCKPAQWAALGLL